MIMLGDGRGKFKTVGSSESGFYVPGDAKALAKVSGTRLDFYVATQNRDSVRVFKTTKTQNTKLQPGPFDRWAELTHEDGRKQRMEFYYGSGYLTQSTRQTRIQKGVKEIAIYDFKGHSRKVKLPAGSH